MFALMYDGVGGWWWAPKAAHWPGCLWGGQPHTPPLPSEGVYGGALLPSQSLTAGTLAASHMTVFK